MLTEQQLAEIGDKIVTKYARRIETDFVERICTHINDIGQLTASDIHKAGELKRIGYNIDKMQNEIANIQGKADKEIYDIFYNACEIEYNGQKISYDLTNTKWVPFAENKQIQDLVKVTSSAVSENIKGLYSLPVVLSDSISGTTGFNATDVMTTGFVNVRYFDKATKTWVNASNGISQPLAEYYQDVIDYAILQVRTGQEDFHSAMRSTIRQMADSGYCEIDGNGVRRVYYANNGKSPYARRLDSSVRNAIMGGQQRLSMEMAKIRGDAFGADGMEISYHRCPRPSHVDFAGKQYNMQDYELLCVPLLNDYNCYHRAFPIVLGISSPTYSQEELEALNREDLRPRTWRGKKLTGYECTQLQRKYETELRKQKDRAVAFKFAGDKDGEIKAKARATAINQEYIRFSKAAGISVKPVRGSVSGYTRGKAVKESVKEGFTNVTKDDKIKSNVFSGALNPNSDEAQKHANQYYEAVRKMRTDTNRIANNTGYEQDYIKKVKEHLFMNKHDLEGEELEYFYPNYEISQSWQRLINGKNIIPLDYILLEHEYMEQELMAKGYSQQEAHILTNKLFNYQQALNELERK